MDTPTRFALSKDAPYDVPEAELVWPEGAPGVEEADKGETPLGVMNDRGEKIYNRFCRDIRIPTFHSFPASADNNTGMAVVICPGGGYSGVALDHEGFDIARFFNSLGISAFVLRYRMPAPNNEYGKWMDGPLNDVARTIRTVRSRASKYGINPSKVGVMGFSSGGHLASSISTLYGDTTDEAYPGISARPDFSILIYAVISLYEGYGHTGSRNQLLGLNPSFATAKRFSAEKNVTPDTPPAFLVFTEDDFVQPENAVNYFLACHAAGVPVEMHQYPEGGHGYSMKLRGLAVDSWPDRLAEWLKRQM